MIEGHETHLTFPCTPLPRCPQCGQGNAVDDAPLRVCDTCTELTRRMMVRSGCAEQDDTLAQSSAP